MARRGSEDSLDPSLRRNRRSLSQRSSCRYSSHDFRGAACLGWKGRDNRCRDSAVAGVGVGLAALLPSVLEVSAGLLSVQHVASES